MFGSLNHSERSAFTSMLALFVISILPRLTSNDVSSVLISAGSDISIAQLYDN